MESSKYKFAVSTKSYAPTNLGIQIKGFDLNDGVKIRVHDWILIQEYEGQHRIFAVRKRPKDALDFDMSTGMFVETTKNGKEFVDSIYWDHGLSPYYSDEKPSLICEARSEFFHGTNENGEDSSTFITSFRSSTDERWQEANKHEE